MVYLNGVTDHKIDDGAMIDHVVELVERKAAEIEAEDAGAPADEAIPRAAGAL
jgi:(E)-4-hydroxy-3-methylbut-2-enyl-diphosphate synthase